MRLNQYKIKISNLFNISLISNFLNTNLLVLINTQFNNSFYIQMPLNIKVALNEDNLFCFYSFNSKLLNAFILLLNKNLTLLKFPFFIKLFLKGLGYKIKMVKLGLEFFLECKLGYSNLIFLKIPSSSIVVTLKKTSLILSGFCKVEIGNFANQIYNLRRPNVYTSKGFRYKRQRLQLKDIKKT